MVSLNRSSATTLLYYTEDVAGTTPASDRLGKLGWARAGTFEGLTPLQNRAEVEEFVRRVMDEVEPTEQIDRSAKANDAKAEEVVVRCSVDAITADEIVCWVKLFPDASIRTSFPRSLLASGSRLYVGCALDWFTDSNVLREVQFNNRELLDEVDQLFSELQS
ncbi:MAG TPA: hypothetical protein VMP01_19910 [Pirellulaceae bacterium]|nr:hypothetical protein [Pirellulaceae bacterium]